MEHTFDGRNVKTCTTECPAMKRPKGVLCPCAHLKRGWSFQTLAKGNECMQNSVAGTMLMQLTVRHLFTSAVTQ